jgi:hypothetical protein
LTATLRLPILLPLTRLEFILTFHFLLLLLFLVTRGCRFGRTLPLLRPTAPFLWWSKVQKERDRDVQIRWIVLERSVDAGGIVVDNDGLAFAVEENLRADVGTSSNVSRTHSHTENHTTYGILNYAT